MFGAMISRRRSILAALAVAIVMLPPTPAASQNRPRTIVAPGMPERLFYMYLPIEMFRLANPQRGEPPLLFPQAKYFTVKVPFAPADLDAAVKAMACHKTQFGA